MYCSQCGTEIRDNSNLCEHCGSPIISNIKRETSINNGIPIPKSETRQSRGKQFFIVLCIILLIVGSIAFIFSFEKSESDKHTPPIKTVVPTPPVKTIIPTSPVKTVVPKPPDETIVTKSTDETIVPAPPVKNVIPKSTDETVIPTPTDETVIPTPTSGSSD
jgi:hypothetical protein